MRIELNTDFLSQDDLKDLAASYHMFETLAERDKKIDCNRVYHVLYTYYLLKYNSGARVTYQLDPETTSIEDFGSVTVSGKTVRITNTLSFKKAAQLASNFEIYPKTNGNVDLSFGFYGLTSGDDFKEMSGEFDLSLLSKENKDLFDDKCKELFCLEAREGRPTRAVDDARMRTLYVYCLLNSIDKYCIDGKISCDFEICSVVLDADIVEFDDMWKFAECFGFSDEVTVTQRPEDVVHMEFKFAEREV